MQQKETNQYQTIIDALINHDFIQAEKLSIELIKTNPLDAQVWLYLAEAIAFQGYGQTAEKIFQRAWLLDPQAAWIEQAKVDLKQEDLGKTRKDIENLLMVKNVTVSAAIIVKDEEKHISNCLKNLVPAVDEIIIVDTGCIDNTIKIAGTFPNVKIIKFDWCDDFSAARNAALPYIKSDWVIWIDADEYLYEEDIENIKIVAAIYDQVKKPILLRIGQMNKTNDNQIIGNYDMNRMFSLKYPFRFYSRIHEQIRLKGQNMYQCTELSKSVGIRVYHAGYTKSSLNEKDKLSRNIKLLGMMIEEEPENPAWLFFYGRELCTIGRIEEGITALLNCEEMVKEYPTFGRILDIHRILVKAYLARQDIDKAEEVCLRSMEIRKDFPDILYSYARIKLIKADKLLKEAEKYSVKSMDSFIKYRSIVSPDESIRNWKGNLLLSDIALYQGRIARAVEGYENTLKVCPCSIKNSIKNKLSSIENEIKVSKKSV